MHNKIIVIKIGGAAASRRDILIQLFKEIKELASHLNILLVHGGGAEVSKVTRVFGIEPVFKDGIRMTGEDEMEIVDMVLAGKMNKYLVRQAASQGLRAIGLSGSDGKIFTGKSIAPGESKTGKITDTDPGLLELLLDNGYFPIIASTSMTNGNEAAEALNINADEAALHIAAALKAEQLIFLSDIPGILKDGSIIPALNGEESEREIADGTITGGMIPKVRSSISAIEEGVANIIIGEFLKTGDMSRLIEGLSGTKIYKENKEG